MEEKINRKIKPNLGETVVKYEKNYLTEVSMKINFNRNPRILEDDSIKVFKEIFSKEFTSMAFEKNIFKNGEFYNDLWIFQKHDKEINLTDSSLELLYDINAEKNFKEILNDVELIMEALNESNIEEANYIGLRYINEITPLEKVEDWNEWINPNLVNLNFKTEKSKLIRGMSRYEYRIDDFFVNIQFGQYNLNYPNDHIRNNFILDYESYVCYEDTRYLKKNIVKMHNIICEFFEESIEYKLKEDLKIIG